MKDYERSLKKKLILLVYILPLILIAVTTYLVNH